MKPALHRLSLTVFLPAIALLLVYFSLRTHALLTFPAFIDEFQHIGMAQDAYGGHLLTGAGQGRLWGPWWIALFQVNGNSQLWVARLATIWLGMIGVAATYSLARLLAGSLAGVLAAALYILTPYLFFFDRLALFDPYVAALGVLTVWLAARFARRRRDSDAILCAISLAMAIGAKATGLVLFPLPALAVLLLVPTARWKHYVRGLAIMYGVLIIIWGPITALLTWRRWPYFEYGTENIGTGSLNGLPERLIDNLRQVVSVDAIYLSPFLCVVLMVIAIYLVIRTWRAGLFLILATLIPLCGVLAFSTGVRPRYVLLHVPLALTLLAAGLAVLLRDVRRRGVLASAVGLLGVAGMLTAWAVLFAVPFQAGLNTDPATVLLPAADRSEYITADSSGFGLAKVADYLLQQASTGLKPLRVVGLVSNCHALAYYIPNGHGVTLDCPYLTHTGSEQRNLAALINELGEASAASDSNYVLWIARENIPYATLDGVQVPYVQAVTFDRPDNITHISLYRVTQAGQ